MEAIHVELGANSYDVTIEKGLLGRVGPLVKKLTGNARVAIITDTIVDALYTEPLLQSLAAAGIEGKSIVFPAGEASKNLAVLGKVYDELTDLGLTRSDVIITLGGGVPGDLGGFAAATYLRGIPFIQIPTTLLAQVDSSVGGKVAIDLPGGKNLAGSFYQPKAVFIDPDLLRSLPARTVHEGLAEVIKYGCIRDEQLFELFERCSGDQDLSALWERIIRDCCTIKARIVERDEHDFGERMLLNFGHTIGHAAERYYGFGTYSHGEAVGAGMAMITAQSERLGMTEPGTAQRIEAVLKKFDLPVYVDAPPTALAANIGHDKKKRGSSVTLILLKKIGQAYGHAVSADNLLHYIPEGVRS